MQTRQDGGRVWVVARIPQDDRGLAGWRGTDQLVDGIELLENQAAVQIRANLRPQRVITGDQKHRELLFLHRLERWTFGGVLRRKLMFSQTFRHRYNPISRSPL